MMNSVALDARTGHSPGILYLEKREKFNLRHEAIVDAINDKNVLPFRIDFINTIKSGLTIKDKQVAGIDTERALLAPERIRQVVEYIREHFDQKTRRSNGYRHDGRRLSGFNSLFATASIEAAKRYYAEFAKQQEALPSDKRLKVGLIYSFAANEEEGDLLGDEGFETEGLDQNSRDFLDGAIKDYNALFGMNYNTSSREFENYYKDLSQRLKRRPHRYSLEQFGLTAERVHEELGD